MSKIPIYIRLDKETVDWFRRHGAKGYQSRINSVLAAYKRDCEQRTQVLVGRAQELFRRYHASCFWHLNKDMHITAEHLPLVREGLRKYGGREGFLLAAELEEEMNHAD